MNVREKWGITRTTDGDLADIWQWPWYWRYPSAAAVVGLATWMVVSGRLPDVTQLVIIGAALFLALSIAYELGCLVVLLACAWAIWAGAELLLPDFDIPVKWQIGIAFAAAIYGVFLAKSATNRVGEHQKTINDLNFRLRRIDEEWRASLDALHDRLLEMESRERKSRPNPLDDWL